MKIRKSVLSVITMFLMFQFSTGISAPYSILPAPTKVSEHVYAWIGPYGGPNVKNKGFRMNMGFVVGKSSILVFETGFYPEMAKEMIRHIQDISNVPIKYAVNSNSQADRYFGNTVFANIGAELIAQEKEVLRMQEMINNHAVFVETSMELKGKNLALPKFPTTKLNTPREIDLGGGVKVKVSFFKSAHTPMPLILHILPDNIVYAGDILYSERLLAVVSGGNIKQWIETFEYLRSFNAALFIPGHGKPSPLKEFEFSTLAYLKMLDEHMTTMVEQGVDMQSAIDKLDQSAFSKLENFEELAGRNANVAFQEAERAAF